MHNPDQSPRKINALSTPSPLSGESRYAILSDLGQLLLRSLDPAVLYEAVIETLERRIGARLVMMAEVNRTSGCFERIAPAQVAPDALEIYPEKWPLALAQPSFWSGMPQREMGKGGATGIARYQQIFARHRVTSSLAVPVMIFGEVRAVLVIRASYSDYFSEPMVELLRQAAASIGLGREAHEQRVRLLSFVRHEARQRSSLRLLSEMIKLVSRCKSEASLLIETCRVTRRLGDYRFAGIGLLPPGGNGGIQWVAGDGACAGAVAADDGRWSTTIQVHSAAAQAMQTGAAHLAYAPPGDTAEFQPEELSSGARVILALPLRLDDVIAGALVIGATDANAFADIEIEIFSEMATELGLGIQMQRTRLARSAAEREVRFNLQHFRSILSNQHSGILVESQDNRVKFVNEAFCNLFGFKSKPSEMENQSSDLVISRLLNAYADPEKEIRRRREILQRGVAVSNDEVMLKDGRIVLRDFTPILVDGVLHGRIWSQRDITMQKMHEARVERLGFYDVVTGLPNRRLLFELLEQARSQAKQDNALLAVGVLDLDRFKVVNDAVGHGGGDQVLAEASSRILAILRKADVLARFGGDEFALVISGLDSKDQLEVISRCILQALRAPFKVMGEQLHLSATIGWTIFPEDGAAADLLVRHADIAMYVAKEEGKDRSAFYESAMELEQLRLQTTREQMAQALVKSHLRLLFQPIVYIDGLPGLPGVAGMEALIRLQGKDVGLIQPADFAHVLDDPQLARPIGRFVLDEAFKQCEAWWRGGISMPVSINISTRHLLHPGFFSDIDLALEAYPNVMNVGFGIEVTETGPAMDPARAAEVIRECRVRGIRVGLDDFGTGNASLSHVQRLDIEHIKLDQSFVRDILTDKRNQAIAAGVITTARLLAKVVIAEGVESAEQGDMLASLGCHQLQGFSIARPMASDEVPGWVAGWVPPASWVQLVGERHVRLNPQVAGG